MNKIAACLLCSSVLLLASCSPQSVPADEFPDPEISVSDEEVLSDNQAPDTPEPPPESADSGSETDLEEEPVTQDEEVASTGEFILTSPVMVAGGSLPVDFTCDGQSASPSLFWQGAPEGTVGYALAMHHETVDGDTRWYWLVYNIPATKQTVEIDETNFGTHGTNSSNSELNYAPPCSKGDGKKLYTFTIYALAAAPDLPDPVAVDHGTLLAAISGITLAEASMDVTFDRTNPQGISSTSSTNCEKFQSALALYANLVSVSCDDEWAYVETESGMPEHEMMAGITGWIMRVPLPYQYVGDGAWRFPVEPTWLDAHAETHSRGPVAMVVNGVPLYHYDKRPIDTFDDSYIYESKFDTVTQGELDRCGGHAGEGDDYHYHYAPVCLLDDHDLNLPVGFTLGGAQIFYGTGADDYYGDGRYSDINNLPDESLDECNAIQLADGSYIYYTTSEPPYIVGCHHEAVDWSIQIEASGMRPKGEFGSNHVEVLSYSVIDGVRTLLFETDRGEINAIVVTAAATGEECYDFEFRTDVNTAVAPETHCRKY